MRQWFYGILISGLGLFLVPWRNTSQADTDDPTLQGDWRVVSVFRNGSFSPVSEGYLKVFIYDNKIVFTTLSDPHPVLRLLPVLGILVRIGRTHQELARGDQD